MRVIAVLLCVFALVGCQKEPPAYESRYTTPPTTTPPPPQPDAPRQDMNADGERTIYADVNGDLVRLDLPLSGPIQRVAVWFHGQGGNRDTRMNTPWLNVLRDNGWAIASADFGPGGTGWGNKTTVDDAVGLVKWATETAGGITPTLWVAGSMGAATSLNALIHTNAARPRCWYGSMPVIDLTSVGGVPGATDQVSIAWRGAVPPDWNPANNIARLPRDITYRIVASPQDTQVPATANGQRLYTEMQHAGFTVSYLDAVGEHGDDSHTSGPDLRAFAQGC